MKILITGCKGLVGSNLIPKLKHEVLGTDIVNDVKKVIIPKVDLIVHLAALNSSKESIENPVEYFETNVAGTINLLEQAKLHHAKFMYLNTVKETEPNPYGVSKRTATEWIQCYRDTYNLDAIINLVGNLYGPGGDEFFVNKFVQKAVKGEAITVYGDGSDKRSLLHIDDLTDFMVSQIDHFEDYNQGIVPISGGEDNTISIKQLLDFLGVQADYQPALQGQNKVPSADTALTPKIGWQKGVKKLYDYYSNL